MPHRRLPRAIFIYCALFGGDASALRRATCPLGFSTAEGSRVALAARFKHDGIQAMDAAHGTCKQGMEGEGRGMGQRISTGIPALRRGSQHRGGGGTPEAGLASKMLAFRQPVAATPHLERCLRAGRLLGLPITGCCCCWRCRPPPPLQHCLHRASTGGPRLEARLAGCG